MTEAINLFDLGVVIIIGLSALLSFFRGFMKEVFSLGAWVGASIIALVLMPTVSRYIEPQVKSAALATAISSIGTFLIALVLISIIINLLVKFIKTGARIGLFDNLLGLAFGVARGVLIVAIAYFVMTIVLVEKDYPDWIKHAKTRPYVAKAANEIAKLTTDSIDVLTQNDSKDSKKDTKSGDKKTVTKEDIDTLIKKLDMPVSTSKSKLVKVEGEPEQTEDDLESSLPSIEDLQRRIKEENEKNDVR